MTIQPSTPEPIDECFQIGRRDATRSGTDSVPFDFRQVDRISKPQLTALHFLHEHFVRSLTSSLTVYLRSYVSVDLIGVEQLPYADFARGLAAPTCLAYLSMQPYEGYALVEIHQSLVAPILDLVLGGHGKDKIYLDREITEIEESMMESVFQVIANDLIDTWKSVVPIKFAIDTFETNPLLSKRIAPSEAVVAISMKLNIGERSGPICVAIPSISLKAMRQRFDQQPGDRKTPSREIEMEIRRKLSRELVLSMNCELAGAHIRLGDLLNLAVGDVIDLNIPCNSAAAVMVNGTAMFTGIVTVSESRMALMIQSTDAGSARQGNSIARGPRLAHLQAK